MGLEAHAPVSAGSARVSTLHVHVSLSSAVLLHWVFAEVVVDGLSLFFLCPGPSLLPCSADALDAAGPAKARRASPPLIGRKVRGGAACCESCRLPGKLCAAGHFRDSARLRLVAACSLDVQRCHVELAHGRSDLVRDYA